jgi:hypothetical protein
MARTAILPTALISPYYPSLPLIAASADLLETAIDDPTDRETTLVDKKTVVLAHNTDTVARTITISSVPDTLNRVGDITAYSIAAGKIARFGPFNTVGWASSGKLNIDVSSPLVRLSVLTLP